MKERLARRLPDEPAAGSPAARLAVRMPDGGRSVRAFPADSALQERDVAAEATSSNSAQPHPPQLRMSRRSTMHCIALHRIAQHCAATHGTAPRRTSSHCIVPYHTTPALPCLALLCPATPYHTIPYHTIPYHAMPYHTIQYHVRAGQNSTDHLAQPNSVTPCNLRR